MIEYLKEMRIKQWYKAAIVFSGPLFAGELSSEPLRLFFAFLAFGLIASSVYVINDIKDVERDRKHPKKRSRPIASGRIGRREALSFSGLLFLAAVAFGLASGTAVFVLAYFALMMAYTFYLKRLAIVDAFTIAAGFLLRAVAGCVAIGIQITSWFYLTVLALAVYLAFCKRLSELALASRDHKESLESYGKIVEMGIAIAGAMTLSLYSLYAAGRGGIIVWSVPLSMLGLLLHLRESVEGKEVHESITSPELAATAIAFIALVVMGIYSG